MLMLMLIAVDVGCWLMLMLVEVDAGNSKNKNFHAQLNSFQAQLVGLREGGRKLETKSMQHQSST